MAKAPADSVQPRTRAEWRTCLEKNHTRTGGVWLVSSKKATNRPRVEYDDAVEEALCFGWVDSKPGAIDSESSMRWFAPRKPGSGWAKTNKARVERLIASGWMHPSGLAKVEAAKADGSWNALDAVELLEVPPDLAEALARHGEAHRHFSAFPRSVRRSILGWIASAKKAETRAKRVEETARLAGEALRANQWRPS